MIATKRRKLAGRSKSASTTIPPTVGLKAYLVHVEGDGFAAIFAVACGPENDPIEMVKAVQNLGDQPGLTFEVIPAEGLCVHLAGDVLRKQQGPRP